VDKGWEVKWMKTKRMHLIAGVTMFVLCISVCTTTVNAVIFWEDDFSDPNLPGWTIFTYENDTTQVTVEGNFSAASGMLEVLDDDRNFARHNSTVNVGTWSFDMYVPDEEDSSAAFYVYFMSNGSRQIPTKPNKFIGVGVWKQSINPNWRFIVWTMNGLDILVHSDIVMDPVEGWHHVDISRASDGYFEIYRNGTFEDKFTHNVITTSTYLEFYCYSAAGAAIDNLVVNDTVFEDNRDPTATTTTTTTTSTSTPPPLPGELIVIAGVGIAVAVIVLAIVILKRR
jgi:hypothetical protein